MQILRKINKKRLIQIILVILAILVLRWYINRDGLQVVPVRKISVEQRIIEKTITTSGEVKSVNEAVLSFNSLGRVSNIEIEKGQRVEKGDYLAQLDYSSLGQSVQALKDARDIAKREKDLFVENYGDNRDAYGGNDEYLIKLRQLDEAISQAEATYNSKLYTVTDSYIYAPFDGVIIDVYKKVGESSSATEAVIKIADVDQLEFEIILDQEDYGLVKLDQKVHIELDSYPNVSFDGEVIDLPLYANGSSTPDFTVKIKINQNNDAKPLLGMTGEAEIVVYQSEQPVNSVFYDEIFYDEQDNPFLWKMENGFMKKQSVETGVEGDLYTEILTPVEGDVVVPVNEDQEINEGYKAKVTA